MGEFHFSLARYRRSGEFFTGGGSVNDALHEIFSAVAGMVKFLAQRFRSVRSLEEELDYSDLDEFMDQEAERSTVFA
jgi:hypothetical protein